jgi:hypothetical protein
MPQGKLGHILGSLSLGASQTAARNSIQNHFDMATVRKLDGSTLVV